MMTSYFPKIKPSIHYEQRAGYDNGMNDKIQPIINDTSLSPVEKSVTSLAGLLTSLLPFAFPSQSINQWVS
jgi:hypothetical protein